MNKAEFKKTLSENDRYWSSKSPAQRVMTPMFQLSLWIKHGDFIGCYLTKAQRRRARLLRDALADEVKRLHEVPRLNYVQSLAFSEAQRLLDQLYERWFPMKASIIQFRRSNATGSARIPGVSGDTNLGGPGASFSDRLGGLDRED